MRYNDGRAQLLLDDVLNHYSSWLTPDTIVSDGPYGVGGYEGDLIDHRDIPDFYAPHVAEWSGLSSSRTTLWFWNTEIGWTTAHPILEQAGWIYRGCNIWDKGVGHIAGNCNGQTMRKFPIVTEVCVHYTREPVFEQDGRTMVMKEWLRAEWKRTGLTFHLANEACGVRNAATRKYLTQDHMFYPPPPEMMERLSAYANLHGDPSGRPYFHFSDSADVKAAWHSIRAKFNFEYGVGNVWRCPAVRGDERAKIGNRAIHNNQKPLRLMERIIRASTDAGDIVWEPFGGLCSASVVAKRLGRLSFAAEIQEDFYRLAVDRLANTVQNDREDLISFA